MIDENKLLEAIEKIPYVNGNYDKENANMHFINGVQTAYELITDCIKKQPKANEWIPVTERLPKELQPVLVAYRGYYDKKIYSDDVAYIRCDDWVWNCDESDVIVEIVAWQPLPKPYEEKEYVKQREM